MSIVKRIYFDIIPVEINILTLSYLHSDVDFNNFTYSTLNLYRLSQKENFYKMITRISSPDFYNFIIKVGSVDRDIDWKVVYNQYIYASIHFTWNSYPKTQDLDKELVSSYFIYKVYPRIYEELKDINLYYVGMYRIRRGYRDGNIWTALFNLLISNRDYFVNCDFLKGSFDA